MEEEQLFSKIDIIKLFWIYFFNEIKNLNINRIKAYLKIQLIIFFLLIVILPLRYNILLCTVAKEENKYIKEFVNHYKKLKIKKIIIYDNNDIEGENFNDILKDELKNNFVKIINYRGVERPQIKAFNDCYKRYNQKYDWIAFYDIDEFLHIINFTNINEFLSLPRFKKCQSILNPLINR